MVQGRDRWLHVKEVTKALLFFLGILRWGAPFAQATAHGQHDCTAVWIHEADRDGVGIIASWNNIGDYVLDGDYYTTPAVQCDRQTCTASGCFR